MGAMDSTQSKTANPAEPAVGSLPRAFAVLRHLADKLPVSRMQRDLTDSTVLRNMGVALGYALLGYDSLLRGLDKLEINREALAADVMSPLWASFAATGEPSSLHDTTIPWGTKEQ